MSNLKKGLIHYWPLNGNARDYVGTADGTVNGMTYSKNQFGKSCGSFDGTDDSLRARRFDDGNVTISLWFNAQSIAEDDTLIQCCPLSDARYGIQFQSDGKLCVGRYNGSSYVTAYKEIVSTGTWHHVVFVWNGTDALMYFNGTKVDDGSENMSLDSANDYIQIGSRGGVDVFDGCISDIKIWNRVLTQDEVKDLYHSSFPRQKSVEQPIPQKEPVIKDGLVGAWLFKGTNEAEDISGNGNDATLSNTPIKMKDGGYDFDASNSDYIETGYAPSGLSELTFTGWLKYTGPEQSVHQYVIGNNTNNCLDGFMTTIYDNKLYLYHDGENKSFDFENTPSEWLNFAGTIKEGDNFKWYVNGSALGSELIVSGGTIYHDNKHLFLATNNSQTADRFLDGSLKEITVYNRELSHSEIKQIYEKSVPDNSLILHVKDGTKDLSRYSRKLTNSNTVVGDNMEFNGSDSYIEIPHDASQLGANLTNGFTISAWINPRSSGEANVGAIIDKETGDVGVNGFNWRMSDEKTSFRINNGTGVFSGVASVPYGRWTHVLITITSAQIVQHYINGVANASAADTIQGIATITTTEKMRIGNNSNLTTRTFDGGIKDVKMWNRVLTPAEIKLEYEKTRRFY